MKVPPAMRDQRLAALLEIEHEYRRAGTRIAGVDEAGRGPLAGPVTAGCVVMPAEPLLPGVDDSKKLSAARRESVYSLIMHHALYAGIGWASHEEIDRIGIVEATRLAMRRAAQGSGAELFLVDAVRDVGLPGKERALIRGDALSYSIAAASILAKVLRDREMCRMDQRYPGYGFARNKGYGTPEHMKALKERGPCPIHRNSFIDHLLFKP